MRSGWINFLSARLCVTPAECVRYRMRQCAPLCGKVSRMRSMNFSAGPAALPEEALEQARTELLDFSGSGMSVMEQSHRGKVYEKVHDEATNLLRELLAVPESHEVLFVQGGASLQFVQVAMNFLEAGKIAGYLVNGAWGEKAYAEACVTAPSRKAEVKLIASTAVADALFVEKGGEEKSYTKAIAKSDVRGTAGLSYVHVTSNETVHGIQYPGGPAAVFGDLGAPLICDMSSDFLSAPLDVTPYSFIYAGAQKNIGPSGVVVLVASKELLARCPKDVPNILRYDVAAKNRSLYNTPPTFAIYLVRNVLAWLKGQGGLGGIAAINAKKAAAVYGAIDAHGSMYRSPVALADRSRMNVVFHLSTPELTETFLKGAEAQNMIGLKGYRTVGGVRASLYNAVKLEWVLALAAYMKDFAAKHG